VIFKGLLDRRLAHEPLVYITGRKEFWSLEFEVGPGVLIPRPETETLVEQALAELPDREHPYRVLDLGTGSGCLLIALLKEFPNATGLGIDSSDQAIGWVRRNVASHRLESRCQLEEDHWAAAAGSFDLIVSNPPYIPSAEIAALLRDVRDYEPREALDGGPDGLEAYRSLGPIVKRHLGPAGVALLEISAGQHHMVERIMAAEGLRVPRIAQDLAGIPRCVVVRQA
jgi:release factor glutamine methyltransferase